MFKNIILKKIESFKAKWPLVAKGQNLFIVILVLYIAFATYSEFFKSTSDTKRLTQQSAESPDTIIPKGFVLVPIELKNADSLSALIDNFAIVDLYAPSADGKAKGLKVGHHLRLLRAPLNPNTFAVLVPDAEANTLIGGSGPLVAVIQNRELLGHGYLEKDRKKTSHVQYYIGG